MNIYLPLIILFHLILGVQIEGNSTYQAQYLAPGSWARLWVRWNEVEEVKGIYTWSADLDTQITALNGHPLLLNVKNSPVWTQSRPGSICSMPQNFEAYRDFLMAVIDRYHPAAVEIWNEPDVDLDGMPADLYPYQGCWGENAEAGKAYSRLMNVVYPAVKQRYPDVLVFAGALAQPNKPFWTAAIQEGINKSLDMVSFHQYVYSDNFTGPMTTAKTLKGLSPDKPLAMTETSLLYNNRAAQLDQLQADYLSYLLGNALENGVDYVFWYTLAGNGWRNSDLVDGSPKPAWYVYNNFTNRMAVPVNPAKKVSK